ncbi:MAG TPA: glycosyltransferase family 4 protein [Candidatus Sulfotelmatobacter sp.]|jgi:glycosyltransferase involved in cell wall biosynthesis
MVTVAYLSNQFPSPVEPYVVEEIEELRRRGVRVIAGSVRKPKTQSEFGIGCMPEVVLEALPAIVLLRAAWFCVARWNRISSLMAWVFYRGPEGPYQRMKALAHTWLGACYAVRLEKHGVDHIHVHHGYFGSWIAMVAARLVGAEFSMTLHGSDLLLHGTFLEAKLRNCAFCLTVSEYNRNYVLEHYAGIDPAKVIVSRMGVEVSVREPLALAMRDSEPPVLLAVGRLHAVKDHAFLLRACAQLRDLNADFTCLIAGEGPERRQLEALIQKYGLQERVTLLGEVARSSMTALYDRADAVVLTSRSEGIPLVLMEAMARGKIVLAPAITGIPELVIPGETGFLYEPGSLSSFVQRLLFIRSLMVRSPMTAQHDHAVRHSNPSAARQLDWVRHAARVYVRHNFNRQWNLESFGDLFLQRVAPQTESVPRENFVLQQI